MSYSIVVDENIDPQVVPRLEADGQDAVHVESVSALGKGTDDAAIAAYSLETDRLILSADDDFLSDFDATAYAGLLFLEDDSMGYRAIGEAVSAIASLLPQSEVDTVYVSRRWL